MAEYVRVYDLSAILAMDPGPSFIGLVRALDGKIYPSTILPGEGSMTTALPLDLAVEVFDG